MSKLLKSRRVSILEVKNQQGKIFNKIRRIHLCLRKKSKK